jgi:hypothetical protein
MEVVAMPNECKGTYRSTLTLRLREGQPVNPPLEMADGEIEIDAHMGSSFTGRRRKSDDPIPDQPLFNTNCQQSINGVKIRFLRQISGEVLHYDGTLVGGVIRGSYFITSGPPDPSDQGTWEAQQIGQFTDDEDEQEDKPKKKGDESEGPRKSK